MVAAIHKIIHSCHILSVKCVALLEANTNKYHHGAQFSIPVSALHQSSFNIHLWEVISLCQNSVYGFKCFVMWNFAGLVMAQPQPLTKAVYRQELYQITAVLAHFTSV